MSVAIKIENVSKLYRLGTVGTGTISHDLNRWWHNIRGKEDPYAKVGQVNDRTKGVTSNESREASKDADDSSPLGSSNSSLRSSAPDYVWALKDINLEVQQGEILGIIGRNGAGKSTLLKLLSRVTAPTTGSIHTRGRIASLLEVGTGFHPELTGRENIYLNGAILGMKRHEVALQLDAIVDFSGCAKYLDTPVKRYSSGMMVRLGFAVAAHLQCETLIVDEVLAVGDHQFQQACISKMGDISHEGGRTILLVSHNLATIRSLCTKACVLNNGMVQDTGSVDELVESYLNADFNDEERSVDLSTHENRLPKMEPYLRQVSIEGAIGSDSGSTIPQGTPLVIRVRYSAPAEKEPIAGLGFIVETVGGVQVGGFNSYMAAADTPPQNSGEATFTINSPLLSPGRYFLTVSIGSHQTRLIDKIERALCFTIEQSDVYRNGYSTHTPLGCTTFMGRVEYTN